MALTVVRSVRETILELKDPDAGLFPVNHIFEPEYHQPEYVDACERTRTLPGAFQIGDPSLLVESPHRGIQPVYADSVGTPETLEWEGMVLDDGTRLDSDEGSRNVCAIKSASVRFGYVDFNVARSVTRSFYTKVSKRASVKRNDVLINSTGDGTIGRVAVYNYDFPAIVDGHITVLRYKNPMLAWYVAAYLLSDDGQKQIYRYINGSSGQVEIYPQDIERVWVKPAGVKRMKQIVDQFRTACETHDAFARDLKVALRLV